MEPTRNTQATLVDLIDRILDKGLILNADLIIHIAGIPLLGVNLKACLAGMETMLKYGIWQDWDEAQRAVATEERRKKKALPSAEGEEILYQVFASYWYSKGIYHTWRPGQLYITNQRIFLFRQEPPEILFQTTFEEIRGVTIKRKRNIAEKETDYLYLLLQTGEVVQLHPGEEAAEIVKNTLAERIYALGLELEEIEPDLMETLFDERATKFLEPEEQIIQTGKVWHRMNVPAPGGVTSYLWKPGYLYLTNKRILWWYDFDQKVSFCKQARDNVKDVIIEIQNLSLSSEEEQVLVLICQNKTGKEFIYFSSPQRRVRAVAEYI